MSDISLDEAKTSPDTSSDHAAPPTPPTIAPSKATQGRVGQRAPSRDPVGETMREEKATRCAFSGVIDVTADQITAVSVAQVECPECGAMRTLHPQGGTMKFPSHSKRTTRTPRGEVRWIRQGLYGNSLKREPSFLQPSPRWQEDRSLLEQRTYSAGA